MTENTIGRPIGPDMPSPFNQLPADVQGIYGTADVYNTFSDAFKVYEQNEAEKKEDYDKSIFPQFPEAQQFTEEIEDPHFREDPETGINYAVYRLNRDRQGPPLIVEFTWSVGAETRSGRPFLHKLAENLDRPIIAIDSPGMGKTSQPDSKWLKQADFAQIAASKKRVLDQELDLKEDEKFDIAGVSLGGVMAANLASQYGEQVGQLITVSTPSFKEMSPWKFAKRFAVDEGAALKKVAQEEPKDNYDKAKITEYYEEIYGPLSKTTLAPEMVSLKRRHALARYFMLMTEGDLKDLDERLDPNTQWTDMIGSNDAITDSNDHLAVVRRRQQLQPDSRTQIQILGSQPHAWTDKFTLLADHISGALREPIERRERKIIVVNAGKLNRPQREE